MLKRILTILLGMALGSLLAMGVVHGLTLLGWGSRGALTESSDYVREVMALVKTHYVDPDKANAPALTSAALAGMVSQLDPHSQFLPAREYSHLREDLDSEFGGIGVQIEVRQGRVVVIAPISGTPGERAGILRGDQVLSVDGENMRDRPIDDVVSRLRGKPGTPVEIAFERNGREEPFNVTIVRERIRVQSVTDVTMAAPGIGYLRLTQFSEPTADELRAALDRLEAQGMKALVLDVRNNPGGLLTAAAASLEPFFAAGELLVYTEGRDPARREEFRSRNAAEPRQLPLAVLINAGSASAAEIMAGALKDAGKAVIIGERSFGKGSVQSVFRLRDGEALRLTTAKYFTPSGVTIHERGIEPQVDVVMTPEEDAKAALQRARSDLTDPVEFEQRFGFPPVEDRQLTAALAILQAALQVDARDARRS